MLLNKHKYNVILFTAAVAIALLAGKWSQDLFTNSEFVHFSINFPSVPGHDISSRSDIGGPWTMIPDNEWNGFPGGGLLVWGREGELVIDIGKQGILKRLLQPNDITISSHWIRNIGTKPVRIGIGIDICGFPYEWDTFEKHWDMINHESTREIPVGGVYNMDWHITINDEDRNRREICCGSITISNAETGVKLADFPIKIINSKINKLKINN